LRRDLFVLIVEARFSTSQEQRLRKLKQTKMEDKIQELQVLEQSLQNILMQRQAFQMELSETESALEEMEKAGDEVFKIVGQLMIKSNSTKIKEELLNKQKIIELRLKNLEKQEDSMTKEVEKLRNELIKSSKK